MRDPQKRRIGDDLDWARDIVGRAWQADIGSSDNEVRFLMDMDRSFRAYGARTMISRAQIDWLRGIERRLDRAEADGAARPVDEVLR